MSATGLNAPWYHRFGHALRCSLRLRMVLVFLLLAMAMSFVVIGGVQKAFSVGWREAARPLLMDYVDRMAAEMTVGGHPDVARAQALTQRLPLTIDIVGPTLNWRSHPAQARPHWWRDRAQGGHGHEDDADWGDDRDWQQLLQRTTADGHRIEFGLSSTAFDRRTRFVGYTLATLLVLTLFAYLYVRRLLRPLDDIRQGAQRFGAGEFQTPIPVRHPARPDELGELATTINTMGQDIQQMLEAQRALLLAISHELRSPLTRARLNTELLPEGAEVAPQREALLRDLGEMARLISDLLESERLAGRHTALHREPTDPAALAREVIDDLAATQPAASGIALQLDSGLPASLPLDRIRVRLLLRNLLDNALRHSAGVALPVVLTLRPLAGEAGIELEVRDHGPGVPEDQLPRMAQPFFRPDTARTRRAGGVGLGLYLCRLVAQAHGGAFDVRNARPGLSVTVTLPTSD